MEITEATNIRMPFNIDNIQAFFALVRAGLWETEAKLKSLGEFDLKEIYHIAEEQSLVGLVAAGLEHVKDINLPKGDVLPFVSCALQLEQCNISMNHFIANLFEKMKGAGIYALLVKGQGIAQCYERPLWRACGDIDLLLDSHNYIKAKDYFDKIADYSGNESHKDKDRAHHEYHIGQWIVELHGTMHSSLSRKMDSVIDSAQNDVFNNSETRIWKNEAIEVALPSPDNDVIFVFTHILQHFFVSGIGLRQICDLSRLLWTYYDEIDQERLFRRLSDMGILSEWKVFGCLIVDYLGLPQSSMPFYDESYKRKGERLLSYIIEDGNFGHNRDKSYSMKYPAVIRRCITLWKQLLNTIRLSELFPIDAYRFFVRFVFYGIKS